jgi:hypothetical protein
MKEPEVFVNHFFVSFYYEKMILGFIKVCRFGNEYIAITSPAEIKIIDRIRLNEFEKKLSKPYKNAKIVSWNHIISTKKAK